LRLGRVIGHNHDLAISKAPKGVRRQIRGEVRLQQGGEPVSACVLHVSVEGRAK
jgi:hypothetical protein